MSDMEVSTASGAAPAAAKLTTWQRIALIFSAPSKSFEDIKLGNRNWWLPFVLVAVSSYIFLASVAFTIGVPQVVANQVHLNPQAEERMAQAPAAQREMSSKISLYVTEGVFIANPLLILASIAVLSLGLLGTINFVFGGRAKYGSIVTVWFYASLPSVIKTLLGTVVLFAGEPPESFNIKNFAPTNIGAFLNPLETNKALYALATSMDAITIWTLILLAIGTATVAGVKRSSGYIAVFGWWAVFVLVGVGWAVAFG